MAKLTFTAFGKNPDGTFDAVDTAGKFHTFDTEAERAAAGTIIPKASEGEFVQRPAVPQEDGTFKPGEISRFRDVVSNAGNRRTVRNEFLGEIQDRKAEAERRMAGMLAARMGAKQKLDQEGRSMGYTQSQQKTLTQIQDSRAKSEQDVANKRLTPEQMQLFEKEYQKREALIMPQMIRQPPSPQAKFQSSLVTLGNGRVGQVDQHGMWKEIETGVSIKDYADIKLRAYEQLQNIPTGKDKDGNDVFGEPDAGAVNALAGSMVQEWAALGGLMSGANMGGQPGQPGQGQPQPQGTQATDLDRSRQAVVRENKINAMVEKSGKPREQVIADIEKAAGQQAGGKEAVSPKATKGKLQKPVSQRRGYQSLSVNQKAKVKSTFSKQEEKNASKAELAGFEYEAETSWPEYEQRLINDDEFFQKNFRSGPTAASTEAIREYDKGVRARTFLARRMKTKNATDEAYNNYRKHILSLGRKPVPRFKFVKTLQQAGGSIKDYLGDER